MFQSTGETMQPMMCAGNGMMLPPASFAVPDAPYFQEWGNAVKRAMDVVGATLALVLFALPMAMIALLIMRESRGPILFRQHRIGRDGTSFLIWKFRTMHVHAAPAGHLCQARLRDPRITCIGAVLRRLSLDELPQLVNVILGDMSLVGPRPHAPGTCAAGRPFEQVASRYAARHSVRPGLTGLAQVRGWRGETDTEDKLLRRVDSDLEYIATWSLWLDLKIMARTLGVVFCGHNAY